MCVVECVVGCGACSAGAWTRGAGAAKKAEAAFTHTTVYQSTAYMSVHKCVVYESRYVWAGGRVQ